MYVDIMLCWLRVSKLAKQEQISTHQAKKGSGGNNNSNMNT